MLEQLDGERSYDDVAQRVTETFGRGVSADNVRTLVQDKLRPLGVVTNDDGTSPPVQKADPLLALRFRKAVIPQDRSQAVASLFKPLFFPPVWMAALAGLVAFDAWLFLDHGVAQAFRQALYQPFLMLVLLALVVLAAGWHEFGHAAGCAYGGACPGVMGAGIYLAYPAFYTDVTDSYRLDRRGRLRTDLAGVYFNTLFILATAGLYALTRWEALLLVIVVQHIEIAHQLLPFLRLDGYYIVADFTGVPDMFARIKPILTSALPGREPDPSVTQLKSWVRAAVTVWVLLVVPLLLFQLGLLLIHAPRLFATAWDSLAKQGHAVSAGFAHGDVLKIVSGILQSLILIIPIAGIVVTVASLGRRAGRAGWRSTVGKPVLRGLYFAAIAALLGALVYVWAPRQEYKPIRKGERGTLSEGVAAFRRIPTGRAGLTSYERAVRQSPPEPTSSDERNATAPAERDTTESTAVTTPSRTQATSELTPTTIGSHSSTTYGTRSTTASTVSGRSGSGSSDATPDGAP